MLNVKTPEEVLALIKHEFTPLEDRAEIVPLGKAIGRVLSEDIAATEYVPDFDRSTVDGYAVRARDTFGCTDAIPAILPLAGEVLMGEGADFELPTEECCAVPTGGAVPKGADSVVMIEYTEDYGDGTIGISKSAAPGQNMIFRGDDVYPGKVILKKGRVLSSQDIGSLAATGKVQVPVVKKLTVGVISTGDELVPPDAAPGPGQVRDVNSPMLEAMLTVFGAEVINYGIVRDDESLLAATVARAVAECDAVLLSGGSSVGVKDAACRIIESMGSILLHGIAIKPGKPTILGKAGSKPLVGLPGHPVAAYFITKLFVLPLLGQLMGRDMTAYTVTAKISESVSANHGRAQYHCCHLEKRDGALIACPIRGKSGLITTLAGADGYFCIGRDCEGLPKGAEIQVTICSGD
ncbi:MAG: molybdopterin molybdotransferase MoeA [Oscillospiraceae bacterium]|nr:molybdopterin molybdotransferase MoeA [Oscillospiraceae bacterium]